MAFPLEKILNISIETYCKIQNTDACDYDVVGVHALSGPQDKQWALDKLRERVPKDAEVVTNYTVIATSSDAYFYERVSGIALIPKNKK